MSNAADTPSFVSSSHARRRAVVAGTVCLVLGTAACGGSGSAGRTRPPRATARSPSGTPTTRRRSPGASRWWPPGTPPTPTRRSPPRRSRQASLRGGHRRRDHRRQRALPGVQHVSRRGAAVPEAGRPGRARHLPGRRGLRRGPLRDGAEQYRSPDGKYYQIPWKSNPVMIFYNKDVLKRPASTRRPRRWPPTTEFLATSDEDRLQPAATHAI